MLAVLGWQPSELWRPGLTLKQLCITYDAKLIGDWDHTSSLAALIHNLTTVVISIGGKTKVKPKSATELHPYRRKKRKGLVINRDNFQILRTIGNALVGGRRK